MHIRAEIDGGVCGLRTLVSASCADGVMVTLVVETECPKVRAMAAGMPVFDAFDELLRRPMAETGPLLLAATHKLHASCLVPVGILKAIEAAAGLALPSTCQVRLTRAE